MSSRVRRLIALAILLAAAPAVWLWLNRPVEVAVVRPHFGSAAEVVYATGVVEPVRWAKVTSILRERIVELCNCEGETVSSGEVLGKLDDSEARATLAELQARADLAEQDLKRASDLMERRVISRQTFERVENEHSRAIALVAAQKARLVDYRLHSPMDGVVLRRDGEVGEVAEPGEVLFWVGQPKPLQIVADVNEEDIPLIRPGQGAKIRADAFASTVFDATVERITPKGDPVLKTYRVYLSFSQETPLLIGMTSDVNIVVRQVDKTMLVPSAALDGEVLFTLGADGKLERRRVLAGIRGAEQVEILEGLSPGARVVSPWIDGLRDGQMARPVEASAQ